MNREQRAKWDERYRDASFREPEPSLLEALPLMGRGLDLDVAAGEGRNSVALARAGFTVVAADFSGVAMSWLAERARREGLPIMPVVADLEASIPLRPGSFDAVVNISYLDRELVPGLKRLLRPGGVLLFDTFLIDQAKSGHPREPRFLLGHYELYDLLSDMELLRYREGIVTYSAGAQAWRAAALARLKD